MFIYLYFFYINDSTLKFTIIEKLIVFIFLLVDH